MPTLLDLPLFPLATVLFPAGRLKLRIFEPRYVEMTKACIRDDSVFGVALIRAGYEVGVPAIPCDIGCTARIVEWQQLGPDQYSLEVQGETRFRIVQRRTHPDQLIRAEVALIDPPDPISLPDRHRKLATLLQALMEELDVLQFPQPHRLDDAAWVANRLGELLPVTPEKKQTLLEIDTPVHALDWITHQIATLDS